MFNNDAFNSPIIPGMSDYENINQQVTRLYEAARVLRKITKKAGVARLLNISPQNLNGWAERGISEGGLLKAQEVIGCDAIWLRDGTGEMTRGAPSEGLTANEVAELIKYYEEADIDGKKAIMSMAQAMAKLGGSSRSRASNDPQ